MAEADRIEPSTTLASQREILSGETFPWMAKDPRAAPNIPTCSAFFSDGFHTDAGADEVAIAIIVPGAGQDMVGAWKPKSMRRLATSSTVTLLYWRRSRMHSWATRPEWPR